MTDRIIAALVDRRIELGLTQADLAHELRVRIGTIGMWETGQTSPSLTQAGEWARVLGMVLHATVGADLIGEAVDG